MQCPYKFSEPPPYIEIYLRQELSMMTFRMDPKSLSLWYRAVEQIFLVRQLLTVSVTGCSVSLC